MPTENHQAGNSLRAMALIDLPSARPAALVMAAFITRPTWAREVAPVSAMMLFTRDSSSSGGNACGRSNAASGRGVVAFLREEFRGYFDDAFASGDFGFSGDSHKMSTLIKLLDSRKARGGAIA